jgi:isopenicillin N synthase-like dioxygenase
MSKNLIPILDWRHFILDPKSFAKSIRNPFETTGFFILEHHPMNKIVIEAGEKAFEGFFNLPLVIKSIYEYKELQHQVGYTPLRIETGVGAPVPDEKEFFHVFPRKIEKIPELPFFLRDVEGLWFEFFEFANNLMKAIAFSIGEDQSFFKQNSNNMGFSLLRGIQYPATELPYVGGKEIIPGGNEVGMCAWEHRDINAVTLLLAKEKGLELLYEDKWVPVTITEPGQIIVNCADMLEHITNGIYRSVPHRVVCESNTKRSSIPFFFHFPSDFNISPRPQFGEPKKEYGYETAGKYLQIRLEQIKL